jgi:hypothetical protein
MRSYASRVRRLVLVLAAAALCVLLLPGFASAQVSINPTVTPTRDDGGWVYWMALGAIALGALIVLMAAAAYLRLAPRFSRDEEEDVPRSGVRAPDAQVSLQTVWTQARPVSVEAVPAPQPAAVAAAPAPAPAAARPAPAGAPAGTAPAGTEPAAAPAAAGEAPAAEAAEAAAPRPARAPRVEVEPDQETLDRVLQEQLAKGVDRRVAEGRAKSAALRAAREKAGG